MLKKSFGFSIIELMLALCLAGVVGAVAVPNYIGATKTAKGSEARVNLNTFFLGQKIYKANNGNYWTPPAGASVETINKTLGVNLSPSGYPTFSYSGGSNSYEASFAEQSDASHRYSISDTGALTEVMATSGTTSTTATAPVTETPPPTSTSSLTVSKTDSKTIFLEM